MKKTSSKIKYVSLGTISTVVIAFIPIAIVSCSSNNNDINSNSGSSNNDSNNQIDVNNFISSFKKNTFNISAVKSYTSQLPSAIPAILTKVNIDTYFNNIPTAPSGITLTYSTISNDSIGAITLIVNVSASGVQAQKSSVTFNNFLTSNQWVSNFSSSFENNVFNISPVKTYQLQLPSIIPTTLTSTNIDMYFNNIPLAPNGVTLIYTTTPDNITGSIILNVNISVDQDTNQNVSLTLNNFLSVNKNAINNYITSFNNSVSNEKTIISGNSNITASQVPTTTISSADINKYFNNIPMISLGSSSITISYTISNVNNELGTLDLIANLSATNASSSNSNAICISGFSSTFQANQKTMDLLFTNLKSINLSANTNEATKTSFEVYNELKNNTSLTLDNLAKYFNINLIQNVITPISNLNVEYNLPPITTMLSSEGKVIFNIRLTLGFGDSIVSENISLIVSGFSSTHLLEIQTSDISKLKTLASTLNSLSLNILPTQNNKTPTDVYASLASQSNLNLSNLNSYIDTKTIEKSLATITNVSASYSLIQPTTKNLQDGTINIWVILSLNNGDDLVTIGTNLTIRGLLNINSIAINSYINAIDNSANIRGNNTILASDLPKTTDLSYYLINLPTLTNNKILLSYSFVNLNDVYGSANLIITISAPNVKIITLKPILISGFLSTNQNAINNYALEINGNSSLIKGNNSVLPSELNSNTIGSYLKGLPVNSNNLNFSYEIISVNDLIGSVTLIISISALNSVTQTSNPIIIRGFKSQSIESLLSSITANDFDTSLALNKNYPVVNGTFLTLPIWLFNKNNSLTNIISGLPFSMIKSYTISDWNSAFGSAYMTILANSGASTKILLNNIGSGSYYGDNISQINFSSITSAITPSSLNKIEISSNLDLVSLFKNLGVNIYSGNIMYPYITSYQFKIMNTNSNNNNLSITLYFTNPLSHEITNHTYAISGIFLPVNTNPLSVLYTSLEPGSIYANYWSATNSSPGLGDSSTSNSLYIPNSNSITSNYEYKSNATLDSSGTKLPSFLLGNINWPIGYSDANVISWAEIGNNITGVATYTLYLNKKNYKTGDVKTIISTLQVSGFMTLANAKTLSNISVNKISYISTIPTPSNGIINSDQSAANFGIVGINWNYLDGALFGGGIDFYSIVNSNSLNGTINWLFHFKNGVVLSIPISGYSNNLLSNIAIYPKTSNIVAPTNGQISLDEARTYFDFKNLNSEIENTFQLIIVSNSNNTGTINLTITTNSNITETFIIKGFLNISYEVGEIQSLIKFHNDGNSLVNIASVFTNGNLFTLSAANILANNIPNWITIPEKAKTIIKNLISSGVVENTIQLIVTISYTTFANPKTNNFSNPVSPLWTITANGFNSVTYGTNYTGQIFESAQEYLQNSDIFHLSLNKNILKKQTIKSFVKLLSSSKNNFMGTISQDGNFTGGFQGDTSNIGTLSTLYTATQWSTITSLFNLNIKANVFGWNLNETPKNSNTTWWSMINIVCQQKINGILVRVYFGWNAYIDTLIPNSDFITPSVEQIIGKNIIKAINESIPYNQSLDVFKNNQPIDFNLNNIPNWINLTQSEVNNILASSGFSAKDIHINIELPNYVYPPLTNSTNSDTLAKINVSFNEMNNSTYSGFTNNFASAITLFQKKVSISLNSNILNKITFTEFMNKYVLPNNFETRTNNLPILLQMFDINIIPTWFSQWNISNISQATVIPNFNHTSVSVTIYIQDNIWTTILIPVGMFANTPINTNKIMTSQIANSIASNIKLGTSLSNFINNQPITFNLSNIPSWITNQSTIKKLVSNNEYLSNIIVTITLPQYSYVPNPNDTTNSNTSVQISVSIEGDALLSDISFAISNNFQSARSYFQSITSLSLKNTYSSITNVELWSALMTNTSNSTLETSDLTLIQKFFNININNSIFNQWNLNNIISFKLVNNAVSGISITINMQANIWATFVVLANVQSQIANEIAQSVVTNTSLTNFTSINTPITFTLNNIPSWIINQTIIKALIPEGIDARDVSVSFAIPSYTDPAVTNLSSMTSSVITVTINGVSATAITNNFESAQSYFANSDIVSVKLTDPTQYTNIADLYTKIISAGLSGSNETINSNGSTSNSNGVPASNQSIFDISIKNNIFNWLFSSMNYVTCAIVGNTITLRIFIQSNVWYDTTFTSNSLAT